MSKIASNCCVAGVKNGILVIRCSDIDGEYTRKRTSTNISYARNFFDMTLVNILPKIATFTRNSINHMSEMNSMNHCNGTYVLQFVADETEKTS